MSTEKLKIWLCALVVVLLASCKSVNDEGSRSVARGPLSGPEFHSIGFKSGHPVDGETLLLAVTNVEDSIESMMHNAKLINSTQAVQFSVVGTTDNLECSRAICEELSLRRARLVQNWLLENGVPASRLKAAVGQGSPMPEGYSSNEEERLMTRAVRLEID